ncbi:C4-dicarboxylate TRAP transporter large permease protein DctM [Roseovarius sp. EC-HK134]|jgi:tripartite ATP-independent transporter DctM subunit|uniref:TRAP transporter large permease protein n=2 Tax=Roseovarius TaxID=74030 RepID=A0A1V0RQ34_9RHOB|nr:MULTISPECIES: TRAP transporter large permease [Roseovarius]MBS4010542.1 TRAP transporter large permease [Roseovarius sp.]ARE83831.1 C4-dicarboxylate TRAP transporter large permease protein DctM [Roseovarius mucosus]AWZ19532.1 TRAP-type C4-dicarboxylate transport system, large permease component [Roseovarius sp. AK1035]EDM33707.1 TRAP dicarboxylate transporter, DctM subunit [Roseovarius sp. TM1035]MBW4974860.1 TRAP transporter large permease [Roseovarius mucosus]
MWNTFSQTVDLGWDFYGPVILFVVLVALAVPVWAAIGSAAIVMLMWSGALPLSLVGESLFDGIDAFALTAVPLFILTGDVLVRTGLSRKFLNVAEALTQFAKGGFGSATVLVCGMFSAISGSDAAGAAAVGRMTIDRLVESGYPRPYACALVAAGACTGILIPPSIAYIIIGLVLGISASTLFMAALIPGMLILVSILITNIVVNRIYGYEGGGNVGFGEYFANLGRALASGWYAFIVPGIIFYGIFSGRLTPTEAGATAVIVTVILGFILGTLKLADFPAMLISSAKVNGVILPIIAFSLPLAQALAIMGVPQGFVTAVTGLTDDPATLILLMILILIAAGCVMETTPNIVILAPILKPLADNIGMNEIQFCIMMITALGVGFITPPLGLNLFVVSGITGESILRIAWRAVPFVFFMLIVVLLIAYVPAISTTMLPDVYK